MMSKRTINSFLLCLILVIAAFLRLHQLSAHDIWYDEACSIHIAQQPFDHVLPTIETTENTPPLYYFILWFWMRLAGGSASPAAMRLPSVLFGVAGVWATYVLARRLFPNRPAIALTAAAMLALSPMDVWHSRDARAYTLLVLLSLLSTIAFLQWFRTRSKRASVAYVLLSIALVYSHLYGGATLLAHGAMLLFSRRSAASRKDFLDSLLNWFVMVVIVAGALSLYLPALSRWSRRTESFWIEPRTLSDIGGTIREFCSSRGGAMVITFFACIAIAFAILRHRKRPRRELEATTLLTSLFVFNVVVPILFSMAWHPVYIARYAIASLPAVFILAASGAIAAFRWNRAIASTMAGVVIIAIALGDSPAPKGDFRAAAAFLQSHMRAGDTAVMTPKDETVTYDYHVHRPDVARHGFYSSLPFDRALRPNEHVWLICETAQTVSSAIQRSQLRIVSQRKIGTVVIIELTSP